MPREQSRKRVGHLSALLARSKARTADHFKTDECSIVVELGHEGKFVAQIKRFPEGDKLEVAVKKGRWVLRTFPRVREPQRNCSDAISGQLKRRCNAGNTVTETTLRPPQRCSWPIVVPRARR